MFHSSLHVFISPDRISSSDLGDLYFSKISTIPVPVYGSDQSNRIVVTLETWILSNMAGRKAISLIGFVTYAVAQTTYTGCHMHESVSYCFGTDGSETPMTTVMPSTTPAPTAVAASTTAGPTGQTTAVTACHEHGSEIYCIDGSGAEVSISTSSVSTASSTPLPAQYTDCHSHGEEKYCVDPAGNDVLVLSSHETESDHSEHEHEHEGEEEAEVDCHFHAGVE